jgi:Ni,Fe-hydrogenase I cytochrome b subunit
MAENPVFQLAGIAYFIVVFSMTAITGSMIFQKGEKSETEE